MTFAFNHLRPNAAPGRELIRGMAQINGKPQRDGRGGAVARVTPVALDGATNGEKFCLDIELGPTITIRTQDSLQAPKRWPSVRGRGLAALLACGLHTGAPAAQEVLSPPAGETLVFDSGPVVGTLVLPPASDTRPIGIVLVLHDALGPDPRSARYIDQLLGGRIAVVDTVHVDDNSAPLAAVLAELARNTRTQGLQIGLLGFGAGARVAARIEGAVTGRALLYPGCGGLTLPAGATPHAVFLAHGDKDTANTTDACVAAASRLTRAGMTVRHLVYADAGYAWDHPTYGMEQRILLPMPDGIGRVPIAPWPELTDMAASQVAAFFSAAFLGAR